MLYPIASVKDWTPEQWIALVTVLIPALTGMILSIINAAKKAPSSDLKTTDDKASAAKADASATTAAVDALKTQMLAMNNRLDVHAKMIGEVQLKTPTTAPSAIGIVENPPSDSLPVTTKKGSK